MARKKTYTIAKDFKMYNKEDKLVEYKKNDSVKLSKEIYNNWLKNKLVNGIK